METPQAFDPEQVRAFFDGHRTVRAYRPDPIPPEDLDLILHAAQRAPTDATAQLYSLIRITDPELRNRIAALAGDQDHIRQAPEFFLICADVRRVARLLAHRGARLEVGSGVALLFGTVDAVLAAQNLLLAAEMRGYAGCYIGGILGGLDRIVTLLDLPPGVIPVVGLTLGRPAEAPPRRPRVPRPLVVHENGYRDPTPEELEEAYRAMAPITRSGDWFRVLSRYFAEGGTMIGREPVLLRALARQGFPMETKPCRTEEEAR